MCLYRFKILMEQERNIRVTTCGHKKVKKSQNVRGAPLPLPNGLQVECEIGQGARATTESSWLTGSKEQDSNAIRVRS